MEVTCCSIKDYENLADLFREMIQILATTNWRLVQVITQPPTFHFYVGLSPIVKDHRAIFSIPREKVLKDRSIFNFDFPCTKSALQKMLFARTGAQQVLVLLDKIPIGVDPTAPKLTQWDILKRSEI